MIRAAATTGSNSLRYLFVVWLGLTSSLIVLSVTVGSTSASGDQGSPGAGTLGAEALGFDSPAAPAPVTSAGSLLDMGQGPNPAGPVRPEEPDRSMRYGGLIWSVTEVRLVAKADNTTGRPIVVVEAVVSNTLADTVLRVRDSDLALVWPDGQRGELSRFEQVNGREAFSLDPGTSSPVTLVFKLNVLRDPEISALTLEFGESGRIPAVLPLVGLDDPQPFPITGQIDRSSTIIDDPDFSGAELIIRPTGVTVDIDAGPYRAAIGSRLVVIDVTVQWWQSSEDAAHLQDTFWQLKTADRLITPSRITSGAPSAANEDRLRLLFVVDQTAVGTALTVAADTEQSADHAVSYQPR